MLNNYYIKRTFQSVFTLFVVVSLTFGMVRLLPGGPADYVRAQLLQQAQSSGGSVNMAQLNRQVAAYTNIRPDQSIFKQYIDYMISILSGDLGTSIFHQEPVTSILGEALPWTIFIMSVSLIISFSLSIVLGAAMAYKEGSLFDTSLTGVSTFIQSVPYYIAAVVLLYFLAYQGGIFPTGGRMNPSTTAGWNIPFIIGVLTHAALPIISMIVTGFDPIGMRGNSIRVLGEGYMRVAELRGLSESHIAVRYVAKNAILPFYTSFLISIGTVFGGSIILEQIFAYPGVGYYLFQSISSRDYPVMMGGFLLITTAVVIGLYIADLTYGLIDPRANSEGRSS